MCLFPVSLYFCHKVINGNSSKIFSVLNKEISNYIKSLINLNDTFNNPLLEKALISTTSIPAVLGFINRNIENDNGFTNYIKSFAMTGGTSINAIIQGIKIALNSGKLDKKSISASDIVGQEYFELLDEDEERYAFNTGYTLEDLYSKYWSSMLTLEEYLSSKPYPIPEIFIFEDISAQLLYNNKKQ